MTVPLIVEGRVTGVLAVGAAAEPGRFGEHDAARLQELADQAAPALERARLAELEHGREDRAEFLAAASGDVSATLSLDRIAAIGARLGAGSLASWCAVLAGAEDGRLRLLKAEHTDPGPSGGPGLAAGAAGPAGRLRGGLAGPPHDRLAVEPGVPGRPARGRFRPGWPNWSRTRPGASR